MKKAAKKNKLFVIKKYIFAVSAMEALRKEKHAAADDCWIDDEWKKNQENASNIGFK